MRERMNALDGVEGIQADDQVVKYCYPHQQLIVKYCYHQQLTSSTHKDYSVTKSTHLRIVILTR